MSKLNLAKQFVEYFVLFLLLLATSSKAAVNEQIEMFLETPAPNQTITGVLFTRGWAVAPAGIARVELYIDGNFLLEIPLGESRPEVGDMFPSYPGSDTSGFNIGLFYSRFANGLHTATVRVIDTNGDYKEVSNTFTIVRFDTNAPNNFLRDPSKVDLTQATVSLDGKSIRINGMIVDGAVYTVKMEWNTTLQGLAISQITKTSSALSFERPPVSKVAVNNQIEMFLETPAAGQTITGVLFTRGWAVAPAGVKSVELYIDGSYVQNIPLGESRPEVGDMFPSYPGSDTSGFNIGLFYSRFANGLHTATVRVIDTNGDYKEVSNTFTIVRFDTNAPNNFLRDPSKVDLTQATVSLDGNSILVNGMIVDGNSYTVRLGWNTTLQGLAISQVTSGSPSTVEVTGKWVGAWSSSVWPLSGTFSADIVQQGTLLGGSISVPQIGMSDAQLKGSVQGNSFLFGDIDDRITFSGTLTGDSSASGSYVYTALGDSGSWQGSLSSGTAACVDVESQWSVTEQVISHDCDYVQQTMQRRYYIVQNGCLIAGSDDAGGVFQGKVDVSGFSMTGSRPDSGGVANFTSSQVTVSADVSTFNGTASWTWSDGSGGCSGKSSITGSRTQQY